MKKKSPVFCEHANEVPVECKCKPDCYCKTYTCKIAKKSIKKAKLKMVRTRKDGLGEALHSALRKCCDSHPTTIAWNVINMSECNEAWDAYLAEVEKRLKSKKVTTENAWEVLKVLYNEAIPYGKHANAILRTAFKMFSDEDWKGMATFLEEI